MATGLEIPFERLWFREGQTLTARDFRDEQRAAARLGALHNRYQHRTWGIVVGLTPELSLDQRAVQVSPGYAIDANGRDLLLPSSATVALPPASGTLVLAMTYPSSLAWLDAHNLDPGTQVPLAAAVVQNGQAASGLDTAARRYARRLAMPHVASGVTESGKTGWKDHGTPPLWIEASVDTSEAGFVFRPQYFASLTASGARLHLSAATPQSFTARIAAGDPLIGVKHKAKELELEGWTIAWMGIENGAL